MPTRSEEKKVAKRPADLVDAIDAMRQALNLLDSAGMSVASLHLSKALDLTEKETVARKVAKVE